MKVRGAFARTGRHKKDDEEPPKPSGMTREEKKARLAALEQLQNGAETFEDFVARVMPQYMPVPEHLRPLYDLIERSRHEPIRALVSMPPRHGKTETLRLGIAYRCLYDPACQNAYATYGSDLSEETGRAVRGMCAQIGVSVGSLSSKSTKSGSGKVLDWKTSYGGGLKSTSVGGAITGRGLNGLLVIDDPIKGAEAAQSLGERNRVWRWLKSDILSRLQGGCSVIIVQTRWHEDDPIGRMIEDGLGEEWIHINLPAIGDEYGNAVDEKLRPDLAKPLWPSVNDRYPNNIAEALKWYAISRARGEYEWWSLYQGTPRSEDRKIFGVEPGLFQMPLKWIGKRGMIILDPAATAKTSSDFSALGAMAMDGYGDESRMYINEMQKFRVPIPEIIREAKRWQKRYKLPVGVECTGAFIVIPQTIRETEPGMRIVEIQAVKDKYTRAIQASKAWQAGRILVPMGIDSNGNEINVGWDVDNYVKVMKSFTGLGDKEDDVVDCTAHGWNRMYKAAKTNKMGYRRSAGY